MTRKTTCHVCGRPGIRINAGSRQLARITSDCRPWKGKYDLGFCAACGVVQTLVEKRWRKDCEKIYQKYLIYPQTTGKAEQKIFSPAECRLLPRSAAIVRHLQKRGFLRKAKVRILEIGAGAGFLLQQISRVKDDGSLFAVEKSPDCVAKIRSLPKVKKVFPSLEKVPPGFHRVLLIHTLEHIAGPVEYLQACRQKMDPAGLLFVQVPNSESNPFLLSVADHCSHFTPRSLRACLARSGFACVHLAKVFGGKEIAGIFRPAAKPPQRRATGATPAWLAKHVFQLRALGRRFLGLKQPVALFGTSLGATWILSQFKDKVWALLDEDPARVGKKFMGVPVRHPTTLAAQSLVFSTVPFSRSNRLREKLRRFHLLHAS